MPVNASPLRLPVALAVYVGWVLLTLFGMRWAGDGSKKPLLDTVSHGVGWNLAMAVALLAAATLAMRWRDLKFVAPRPVGSLRILWFPSLYLLLFAVLSVVLGLPPAATVGFVLLNTLLVGLSEEWMFRGVLFQALRSRLAMWPSILLMSAMFGAVHVLNVFVTGQLFDAVVQAMAAFLSGVVLVALLVRTGSIWVPIAYHGLWDFGTFMTSAGSQTHGPGADLSQGWTWTLPILLVLPNFIYALFLLRGVRNDTRLTTD
jgi:uncharacterized protein